jgi:murein L,D-transpeptidase YafK
MITMPAFTFLHRQNIARIILAAFVILLYGFAQKNKIRQIERISRKQHAVKGITRIVIDKSDYLLRLYDEEGLLARYPVVFGKEPDKDKFKEGDKRTPEGFFTIQFIRSHRKWHVMMMLDYPTKESMDKLQRRKKEGIVAPDAAAGGAIGIHGTWPKEDYVIDKFKNWTDGCVSLKNNHLDDLKNYVKGGTLVEIRK